MRTKASARSAGFRKARLPRSTSLLSRVPRSRPRSWILVEVHRGLSTPCWPRDIRTSRCSICRSAALAAARERLGRDADQVKWIAADVTAWCPATKYDVWHDRAAFHFLNAPEEQAAYIERLRQGLKVGGYAIIGTFALDGPEKCSGLPVTRHSADTIGALLGSAFTLKDTRRHQHKTPWESVQNFQFSTFLRIE